MNVGDENMDIINIIDKNIELMIRRDALKNTIDNSKRYHFYAKIEGDIAFNAGNYQLENAYNNSSRYHVSTQEAAEKELAQVEQLLEFAKQKYNEAIQSLDVFQLKEAYTTMSVRKTDIERKISDLSCRRSWAISMGDTAFNNHNFEEEQNYNRISSDCHVEIEKNSELLRFYEMIIKDLNNHMGRTR